MQLAADLAADLAAEIRRSSAQVPPESDTKNASSGSGPDCRGKEGRVS